LFIIEAQVPLVAVFGGTVIGIVAKKRGAVLRIEGAGLRRKKIIKFLKRGNGDTALTAQYKITVRRIPERIL
jgi:ATP:corrinoid adenosyltransferase